MPPQNQSQPVFTDAEIEKMRLVLNEHDKKTSPNVFDLNNPPRVAYTHQEFPRLLYKLHGAGHQIHLRVADEAALDAAIESGWSLTPVAAEDDTDKLDEATLAEVAAIDKQARTKKKAAAK